MSPARKSSSLAGKARANVAAILTHALAEELLLSSTTREFYAKVPAFHSLHKLFADQYRQLGQWLDPLAKRMWSLGASPHGHMEELASARSLALPDRVSERTMLGELLSLHEELAKRLEDDVEKCARQLADPGSADLLQRLVEFHETSAWVLRTVRDGSASTPAHGP